MSVNTLSGEFVVLDAHTADPKYFWKGEELTDIVGCQISIDKHDQHIRLRAKNTSTFDSVYVEMASFDIIVKKEKK